MPRSRRPTVRRLTQLGADTTVGDRPLLTRRLWPGSPTVRPGPKGIATGEQAVAAVLAARAQDGATAAETIGPKTTAGFGTWPRSLPAVAQWPQRKPWLLTGAKSRSGRARRPVSPASCGRATTTRSRHSAASDSAKSQVRSRLEIASVLGSHFTGDLLRLARSAGESSPEGIPPGTRACLPRLRKPRTMPLIAVFDAKYPLRLLAAGDRDPQRRPGRQCCHRAGSVLAAFDRHSDAPRVSLRALHRVRRGRHGVAGGHRRRPDADPEHDQRYGQWRRAQVGQALTISCRKWPMPASTMACTIATPPKSARPWASRSARWPRRSTCGHRSQQGRREDNLQEQQAERLISNTRCSACLCAVLHICGNGNYASPWCAPDSTGLRGKISTH